MYEQIAANRRRSVYLILGFSILVLALGWVVGQLTGFGYYPVAIAAVVAIAMSWSSYYFSDKIVLTMSHARAADPAEHARLINIVDGLAIAGGMPVPRVYVVDDPAPNAFATGRDPEHAAVAVTTGLLERMNRVELEGVIAHEMSHIRNRDILVSTIAVVLAGVVILLADWMLRGFWHLGARRRGTEVPAAVIGVIGLLLVLLAPVFAQLMKFAVSRRREMLADSSGIELTRYPPGLISALRKLRDDSTVVRTGSRATAHLWIESPLKREGGGARSWLNRLFDTHPPIEDRIKALESI
ncbi:MAG: M48 family metallopeptidase [Actinomycetota bacterium]